MQFKELKDMQFTNSSTCPVSISSNKTLVLKLVNTKCFKNSAKIYSMSFANLDDFMNTNFPVFLKK